MIFNSLDRQLFGLIPKVMLPCISEKQLRKPDPELNIVITALVLDPINII